MNTFVVAIPLFDKTQSVAAYKMDFTDAQSIFEPSDDYREFSKALDAPGLDLIAELGPQPFCGDAQLFMDINEYQLLMNKPMNSGIDPTKLVCVLPHNISVDEAVTSRCVSLHDQGYMLAYTGLPEGEHVQFFLDYMDYMVLDYREFDFKALVGNITRYVRQKKVVIMNIPDTESFCRVASFSNALYSGDFYSEPITKSEGEISPLKVNALNLMNQINQEDFDLTTAAGIIGKDPSLSISLLRFVDYQAKQISKAGKKIDSIKSAVAIMGQKEVKRWATVAISMQLAEDKPSEITRMSLIRAKFAENLAPAFELGIMAQSLFMTGLFSLLDLILQKPMADAINEVAVDERVRQALVDSDGPLYPVMELIYQYEKADWYGVSLLLMKSNIKTEKASKAFIDALVWYKELLDSMEDPREKSEGVN